MNAVSQGDKESLKLYPAYKNSGLPNIGKIPNHWTTYRAKFCAVITMGQSPDSDDCNLDGEGLPFLQGNAEFGAEHPSPRFYCVRPPKQAQEGDLLLSVRAPVGALNIADQNYGIGRGLCSIRPRSGRLANRYAWHLLTGVKDQLNSAATGSTYDAVSARDVADMFLAMPPFKEQKAIAAFLDRETAKIDAMIAKKEQLIALLEEKRTALISHAVTKGLDPDVPMKDSDVDWLGEIPSHWELKRLKDVCEMNTDVLPEDTDPSYLFQYLDIGNVDSWGEILDLQEMSFEDAPSRARRRVKAGDTIVSTVRTYLRAVTFVHNPRQDLIVSTGFAVLRPKCGIDARFLFRLVQSSQFIDSVVSHSEGVAYPAINPTRLAVLPVWVPPLAEQKAIAVFVDRKTAKIEGLIQKNREVISKLQEYRTALISAAVTGKIDVRGEV